MPRSIQKEKRADELIATYMSRKRLGIVVTPKKRWKYQRRGGSLLGSDANSDRPLGDCSRITEVEPPTKILDTKEPTWMEVRVKKTRTGSAPEPSRILYKMYKKWPKLLRRLWQLFRVI